MTKSKVHDMIIKSI